jgi:hypothetical protein
MCTLEIATELLNAEKTKTAEDNEILWKLLEIDSLFSNP